MVPNIAIAFCGGIKSVEIFSSAKSFRNAALTYAASSTPGGTSFSSSVKSSLEPSPLSNISAIA